MIHVVIGHVCSGKSTHVRQHATPGDVVVDMDRIALALTTEGTDHHDYPQHVADIAKAARWAAIDEAVRRHRGGGFDVWLIHAYPDEKDLAIYRRMGATLHELHADAATLRARALAERPARVRQLLEERLANDSKNAVFPAKTREKTCVFPAKTAVFQTPPGGWGGPENRPQTEHPTCPRRVFLSGFKNAGGSHGQPRTDS